MSDTPNEPPRGPEGEAAGADLSVKDLFLGLVHSFQAAAMQQMGKIANPFTQKMERDLPQAKLSIDMLRMLQERTAGNLTPEESRFLAHVLRELQLNYVMEAEEEAKGEGTKEAGGPEGSGPEKGGPATGS